MTNSKKLYEIFPHAMSSLMLICPAMLYGHTVCPFREEITEDNMDKYDLMSVYNIRDSKCQLCARKFWKSKYDGAEDIDNQKINMGIKTIIPYGTKIIYHGTGNWENCRCYCGHYNQEDDTYNIYNGWDLCHVPNENIEVCEW